MKCLWRMLLAIQLLPEVKGCICMHGSQHKLCTIDKSRILYERQCMYSQLPSKIKSRKLYLKTRLAREIAIYLILKITALEISQVSLTVVMQLLCIVPILCYKSVMHVLVDAQLSDQNNRKEYCFMCSQLLQVSAFCHSRHNLIHKCILC